MFYVNEMPKQLSDEDVKRLQQLETATIGHIMERGFPDRHIRPILKGRKIAGTAVTLALPAQDSTMLHHALGLLRPGDVLVIDRLGDDRYACLGGGVGYAAQKAGALGAVVDGPCTDPAELEELDFPVWSRGISAITTRTQGIGGTLNEVINCGGCPVHPGDAVLADDNGVAIVPADRLGAIMDLAFAKEARSKANHERVKRGEFLGDCSGATKLVLANLGERK